MNDRRRGKENNQNDPHGDVIKRLEAIDVAESVLGEDCTMEDIWRWAESGGQYKPDVLI